MNPTPLQGKQRDSFGNRCDDVLSNLHLCTLIIFTANFTETYHDHYSVLCGRSLSCKDEESNPGLPIVLEQLEWVEPACEGIIIIIVIIIMPVRASVVTEEHNVKLVGSLPRFWFKIAKSFIVSLGPVIKVGPNSVSIVGTAAVSDVKIISPRYSAFEGILL